MSNIFNRLVPLVPRRVPPQNCLAEGSAFAWEVLRRTRDYRADSRYASNHVVGGRGHPVEIISALSRSVIPDLLFR